MQDKNERVRRQAKQAQLESQWKRADRILDLTVGLAMMGLICWVPLTQVVLYVCALLLQWLWFWEIKIYQQMRRKR